ncbi:MAG: RDD family protein [Hyphomicrobiales bacterium]
MGSRPRRPVRLHYATFEARVAAGTLDVLCLFIIASLLVTIGSMVVLISSDFERVDPSTTAINIFWVCVGAIAPAFLLYFFISLAWKGQTVGAAVMQLMVIRSDGRPLGILGSVARVVGMLFYVLILGIGIVVAFALRDSTLQSGGAVAVAFLLASAGFLWSAFDSKRRTLHDRIAGTIVVRIG